MNRLLKRVFLIVAAGLIATLPLQAATVNWNVPAGDFNVGANWDTTTIPAADDIVNIQNDGTATLSGTFPNKIGYLRVGSATNSGSLALEGDAVLNVASSNHSMIASTTGISRLTLKDNAQLNFSPTNYWTLTANDAATDKAIMTIEGSAKVKFAGFQVGSLGSAALYQTGGMIENANTNPAVRVMFGVNDVTAYGYYGMSGGTFTDTTTNEFAFGYYGTGILNQSGGSITYGRSMRLGGGTDSYGEYNMSAGVADYCGVGWNSHVGIGGTGVLNLSGGTMTFHTDTYLGYYGGNGTINLGVAGSPGGTFATPSLIKSTGAGAVNFHGGTLQAMIGAGNSNFLRDTTNYIYGEGAIIDTNGNNATVTSALLAPTGSGVANTIALTSTGAGYLGAPGVRISGGGGTGATAVANFDPATGTVTGITVTNPGTDYIDPSSLVVTLVGGGTDTPAVVDTGSLALNTGNVSGGLTKKGLGKLTLSRDCTYTGATIIEQGTLELKGWTIDQPGIANMTSSAIVVKTTGTLAGTSPMPTLTYYPITTVEAGGTIAPGTPYFESNFHLSALNLKNDANLKFTFDASGNVDALDVVGDVSAVGGSPITVKVNFSGVALGTTDVLRVAGNLDPNIEFKLPTPVIDSFDAANNSAATLTTTTGAGGKVALNPAGAISDPAWSNASGGNWSAAGNWNGGPVPNGGDKRAMFTAGSSGSVAVNLDASPQLSSMIFNSLYGESYTITAADSSKMITLKSTAADNWHISVLAGAHTVAANMKLAAGTGQSVIRLTDDSHLTLSGVLSDETTGAGVNVEGNFKAGTGTGVLTLSGPNTYTGPTVLRSGVLEAASFSDAGSASAIGAASADPSNLVFNGGNLKYVGGIPASTNRGFTLLANATISTDENVTFSGKVTGTPQTSDFTKSGLGRLTFSSLTSDIVFKNLIVEEGTLSLQGTAGAKPTYTINNNIYGDLNVGLNSHTATISLTNVNLALNSGDANIGNGVGTSGAMAINEGVTITSENQFELWVGLNDGNGVVNQTGGNLQVGRQTVIATGAQSQGIYNLSGGSVKHDSSLTVGNGGNGVINQTGGNLEVGSQTTVAYGSQTWGVYNLSAGISTHDTDVNIGHTNGNAVLNQTGGDFKVGRLTTIANGGQAWGVYNMSGGTADINSTGWSFNVGHSGTGQGIINLSGNARLTANTTYLGAWDTGTGILNLGGASTFSAPGLGQYQATATGYFNFHGGVLQATANNAGFFSTTSQMDGIYVYKEGAKIDTNSHDITIASALLAPSGDGVLGIALDNAGSGYIGEPVVQITGGTGTGATARAVMAGDHIDRIEITNPGTGYVSTDVLTVNIVGGTSAGGTSAVAGVVGFQANDTTGGLSKLGAGTLTLSGELLYQGDTFVNEGTLTITTPLNTPAAAVSVATGATLSATSIVADSLNIGVAPLPAAATAVPEPGTLVLLVLAGLAGAVAYVRRK